MNNVYFIGMPGCGKTTVGKQLSVELKRVFVDLDEYIVEASGKSIDELFSMGEGVFRKWETKCLKRISERENLIVATGGGIVTVSENAAVMKNSGTVIFIDSTVESILKNSALEGRPLLKDKSRIYSMYDERISLYRAAADYIVENNGFLCDACDSAKKIIELKYPQNPA